MGRDKDYLLRDSRSAMRGSEEVMSEEVISRSGKIAKGMIYCSLDEKVNDQAD